MKLLFALAIATSSTMAGASPDATCPATNARGIVTTPATQVGQPTKAIRKPSAHKGDHLPAQGSKMAGTVAGADAAPAAVINTSRSNVKNQRVAVMASGQHVCERTVSPPGGGGRVSVDHAINTKGTGATGRAAADHAINTKGTGVAGRSAAPVPGNTEDCDDANARGLVTPAAAGTTDVSATAPRACR